MRRIMGGDFRAISKAEPVAADPRLALVEQFARSAVAEPVPVPAEMLEGFIVDLSGDAPDYSALFEEDSQGATGEPEQDADDSAPQDAPEPADEAPADAEQDEKAEAPKQEQDEQDYDPIAAVLG